MAVEFQADSLRNTARPEDSDIPVTAIRPSGANPRRHFDEAALQELADSIREHGMLEPIVVRWRDDAGIHEIICGERRWRAAQIAGLEHVPCRVLDGVDDRKALELALVENLCRRDIDAIEEAEGYKALMEMGYRQTAIAERVNRSQEAVSNAVRLLKLPAPVRDHISAGRLSPSHGRALVGMVEFPKLLEHKLKLALGGATTRDVEDLSKTWELQSLGIGALLISSNVGTAAAKACLKCSARRKRNGDGWVCLKPECAKQLQETESQRREERMRKKFDLAEGAEIPKISSLKHGTYQELNPAPASCAADCEHRKPALGWDNEPREICVNPKCFEAAKRTAVVEVNKVRRALVDEHWAQAIEILDSRSQMERVTVIACWYSLQRAKSACVDAAAKRLGVEINAEHIKSTLMARTQQAFEALLAIPVGTLVTLTAEAALGEDAADRRANDYHEARMLNWFVGVAPTVVTAPCPVCGEEMEVGRKYAERHNGVEVCGWPCKRKLAEADGTEFPAADEPEMAEEDEGCED